MLSNGLEPASSLRQSVESNLQLIVSWHFRQRYRRHDGLLIPIQYRDFPDALGADTVRLVVIPLAAQATELVSDLEDLCEAFKAALPAGTAIPPCMPRRHVCTLPFIEQF